MCDKCKGTGWVTYEGEKQIPFNPPDDDGFVLDQEMFDHHFAFRCECQGDGFVELK